eukprot:7605379-Pyramimonas_sp.AAC.1
MGFPGAGGSLEKALGVCLRSARADTSNALPQSLRALLAWPCMAPASDQEEHFRTTCGRIGKTLRRCLRALAA